MPEPTTDPTASYRKYPKGPRFGLIVVLSAITLIVLLALGVLFFKTHAGKDVDPYKPHQTPNSSLQHGSGSLRLG